MANERRATILTQPPKRRDMSSPGKSAEQVIHCIPVPRLEMRHSYLVEEGRPKLSLDMFLHEVKDGVPCLMISHILPKILIEGLDDDSREVLDGVPTVWLSNQPGKDCLKPQDIGMLVDRIVSFIEENEHGTVLLAGIEYLVVNNDFQRVLGALARINDTVMQYPAKLIVPLEPRVFERSELALLERDMEMI